jgi:hypothetical protein
MAEFERRPVAGLFCGHVSVFLVLILIVIKCFFEVVDKLLDIGNVGVQFLDFLAERVHILQNLVQESHGFIMRIVGMLVVFSFQLCDTMFKFASRLFGPSKNFVCLIDHTGGFKMFGGDSHVVDPSLHFRDLVMRVMQMLLFAMRAMPMIFVAGSFAVFCALGVMFTVPMQILLHLCDRLSHDTDFATHLVQQLLVAFTFSNLGAFHRFGNLRSDLMHLSFECLVYPMPFFRMAIAFPFGPFASLTVVHLHLFYEFLGLAVQAFRLFVATGLRQFLGFGVHAFDPLPCFHVFALAGFQVRHDLLSFLPGTPGLVELAGLLQVLSFRFQFGGAGRHLFGARPLALMVVRHHFADNDRTQNYKTDHSCHTKFLHSFVLS